VKRLNDESIVRELALARAEPRPDTDDLEWLTLLEAEATRRNLTTGE
jgi:hypothetical protein